MAEITENFDNVTNWTNTQNTLSAVSNQARGVDNDITTAYHNTDLSSTNCYVQASVSHIGNTDGGSLMIRVNSNGTASYIGRLYESNFRLYRSNWSVSDIQPHGMGSTTPVTIRLEAETDVDHVDVRAYINGNLIASLVDTNMGLSDCTKIGISIDRNDANNVEYIENLTASPLSDVNGQPTSKRLGGIPFASQNSQSSYRW